MDPSILKIYRYKLTNLNINYFFFLILLKKYSFVLFFIMAHEVSAECRNYYLLHLHVIELFLNLSIYEQQQQKKRAYLNERVHFFVKIE